MKRAFEKSSRPFRQIQRSRSFDVPIACPQGPIPSTHKYDANHPSKRTVFRQVADRVKAAVTNYHHQCYFPALTSTGFCFKCHRLLKDLESLARLLLPMAASHHGGLRVCQDAHPRQLEPTLQLRVHQQSSADFLSHPCES